MNKELNAAEAVYGFVGWLTTREERTVMSAKDDCAPIAELIKRFCTENNLPEVSDQWPLNLIHPSGEVAVPNAEIRGGEAVPLYAGCGCIAENKAELLAEDIECLHMALDKAGVPRTDGIEGPVFSMWGRVLRFKEMPSNAIVTERRDDLPEYERRSGLAARKQGGA